MNEQLLLAIHAEMLRYGEDVAQEVVAVLLKLQKDGKLPDDPWRYARKIGPLVALKMKTPHSVRRDGKRVWVSLEHTGEPPERSVENYMDELIHLNMDEPERVRRFLGRDRRREL